MVSSVGDVVVLFLMQWYQGSRELDGGRCGYFRRSASQERMVVKLSVI